MFSPIWTLKGSFKMFFPVVFERNASVEKAVHFAKRISGKDLYLRKKCTGAEPGLGANRLGLQSPNSIC